MSRNSSFEKHRSLLKGLPHSPYENQFSDLDVLIVSHGAVIRELVKYFACDLQTDIGQHLDTIQDIAPNTSITRFQVKYSISEDLNPTTTLQLIDYHNKTHLMNANNDEYNLDVVNKCSL
jgi:broad specificity phosphatase PhoE